MPSRILFCRLVLVPAFLLLPFALAHGQRLEDGQETFERSKLVKETRILRNQLLKGEVEAKAGEKEHQDAIDIAAREAVYPLYWYSQGRSVPRGKINRVVEDFTSQLSRMSRKEVAEKTAVMQQLYCRKVIDSAEEVIHKGKAIAGINAALMLSRIVERRLDRGALQSEKSWAEEVLPRLAEGNAEHLATVVLNLLTDAKAKEVNDGVRYHLFRTLSSLLAVPARSHLLKKEIEDRAIQAALEFVEKKVKFPRNTPPEEIAGYQVLRSEAIKVLALSSAPIVGEKGKPALALARIAGGDASVTPPPRLNERIEAIIGLGRLVERNAAKPGNFQADVAALQVARGVEAFGLAANRNIESKGVDRARAWKIDAARLIEAVNALRADGKNPFVNDVVKQCLAVLTPLEDGKTSEANALGNWLKIKENVNDVPEKPLFKGDDSSVIKPVVEKTES